jgi:hypothetical protein
MSVLHCWVCVCVWSLCVCAWCWVNNVACLCDVTYVSAFALSLFVCAHALSLVCVCGCCWHLSLSVHVHAQCRVNDNTCVLVQYVRTWCWQHAMCLAWVNDGRYVGRRKQRTICNIRQDQPHSVLWSITSWVIWDALSASRDCVELGTVMKEKMGTAR